MKYTKAQIQEAIHFWEKTLTSLNEASPSKNNISDAIKLINKKYKNTPVEDLTKEMWTTISKTVAPKANIGGNKFREFILNDTYKLNSELKTLSSKPAKSQKAAIQKKSTGRRGVDNSSPNELSPKETKNLDGALKSTGVELEKPTTARNSAENIGVFDLGARLRRIHAHAVTQTKKAVGAFLNSQKAGNEESVKILNSGIKDGRFVASDGDELTITLQVSVDKAHVTGWKAFMASLFNEAGNAEYANKLLTEDGLGILKSIFSGIKSGTKEIVTGTKDEVAKSVKRVNDELRLRIGVAGLQEYLINFCGKNSGLPENVKTIDPGASSITHDNGAAKYEYSVKITLKI